MKKSVLATLAALLLLSAVILGTATACSTSKASVIDDLGRSVTFDGPVSTIVSLAPSATEIVFAIGAGDKLIGRTDYCSYPPEAASVSSVGGFYDPNKEEIVTLDPDVVLASGMHDQTGDAAWLEEKGLKVVILEPHTLDDVMNHIALVGKLTGKEAEAAQLVESLQSRTDYVAARTADLTDSQKPNVLHITWHDPLWVVGEGSFANALMEIAGGVNVFGDIAVADAQVNLDAAVARGPQVITVSTGHGDAMSEPYNWVVASDSPFRETAAYKSGRVHQVDADLLSRGGPRIVDALELYASLIHPEIFGEAS
jgi:iron complex transport system substrate-binding protein